MRRQRSQRPLRPPKRRERANKSANKGGKKVPRSQGAVVRSKVPDEGLPKRPAELGEGAWVARSLLIHAFARRR